VATVLPTTPEVQDACTELEPAVGRFLKARSTLPPPGRFASAEEALNPLGNTPSAKVFNLLSLTAE
jgi:hypothetical protein